MMAKILHIIFTKVSIMSRIVKSSFVIQLRFIVLGMVFVILSCNAQRTVINPVTDQAALTQGNTKAISTDELGYIYLLTKDNQVHKCNEDLKILFTYSNTRLGNIHNIDVSNPLKLLVYYDQYGIAVTLDNTLSESFILDLHTYNFEDIRAIGLSTDNQIWLYDPLDFKLKKIDRNGQLFFESNSLVHEHLEAIRPQYLSESVSKVYLFDDQRAYLFDDYGKYLYSIDLPQIQDYQINNNGEILWTDGASLFVTTVASLSETLPIQSNLSFTEIRDFAILPSRIVVLDANGVYTVMDL